MADLTITINPPTTNTITISDGVLPHNLSHSPSGSDSLATWYASKDDLAYVSGQIGAPSGVVFTTGDQTINGVKNFSSRPTVNGSGVMLTGETAGTGYLTGYVNKSETGSFVANSDTGSFVTSSQTGALTGSFYPYSSNPASYVQGAVVRPSNTGNFVDINNSQTINGQKTFSTRISAPTANIGTGNFIGGGNGQTVIGDYNGITGSFNYVFGGSGNAIVDVSTSSFCKDNKILGSENTINGDSPYSNVIVGKFNSLNEASFSSSTQPVYTNNLLMGDSNEIFFVDDEPEVGVVSNTLIGDSNRLENGGVGNMFVGSLNLSTSRRSFAFSFGRNNESSADNSMVIGFSAVSSGENTVLIKGESGVFIEGPTSFNNRPTLNGTGFLLSGEASTPSTGYLTGYVLKTETGSFISSGQTGQFYPITNPSGYATTSFVTGISGHQNSQISSLQSATGNLNTRLTSVENVTGSFALSNNTGAFLTTGAGDAKYYPLSSNPSNYLVSADVSSLASTGYVTGVSGHLQGQITSINNQTGDFLTTGIANSLYALQANTGNFITSSQTGSFSSPITQVKYQEQTGHSSGLLIGDFRYATSAIPNVSGNLIFSIPITPTNSGSLININFFGLFSSSGTQSSVMIGRSGETNCRYQNTNLPSALRSDYVTLHPVSWSEIAGTTGLINYEIRAVANNSAIYINRAAITSTYPTNNKSSVLVQEIRLS